MFLAIFALALLGLILVIGGYMVWRQWRAADYAERLDPRDVPGSAHSEAMASSFATTASRMGGGAFGP